MLVWLCTGRGDVLECNDNEELRVEVNGRRRGGEWSWFNKVGVFQEEHGVQASWHAILCHGPTSALKLLRLIFSFTHATSLGPAFTVG